jgi:hypothetical protein
VGGGESFLFVIVIVIVVWWVGTFYGPTDRSMDGWNAEGEVRDGMGWVGFGGVCVCVCVCAVVVAVAETLIDALMDLDG